VRNDIFSDYELRQYPRSRRRGFDEDQYVSWAFYFLGLDSYSHLACASAINGTGRETS